MNPTVNGHEIPDFGMFNANRAKQPPEELIPYAGQTLAWSPDGTRIIASGPDMDAVVSRLQQLGVHFSEVVWEDIPPLDAEDSHIGGIWSDSGSGGSRRLDPPYARRLSSAIRESV